MIVAFVTTVTLLPALLAALKPAGEKAPVGFAALAPIDHFLDRRGAWVVGLTLATVMLGLPLLKDLRFDFNPLDLRSKQVESVSTLLDLMRDPDTSPNTIEILEPDLAQATTAGEGAGGSAGSRTRSHARELRAEGPGREARPDRRRELLLPEHDEPPTWSSRRRRRPRRWRRSARQRAISRAWRRASTPRPPPRPDGWPAP